GDVNIQYRKRNPDGTWDAQIGLTDVDSLQDFSRIAVDTADNIHIAWSGYVSGVHSGIPNVQYIGISAAGVVGAHEWATSEPIQQYSPELAIDESDNVYFCITGLVPGNGNKNNVRYRKRNFDGTWEAIEEVTAIVDPLRWDTVRLYSQVISIDVGGNLHIVWEQDDNLWHRVKLGPLWRDAEQLTYKNDRKASIIWRMWPKVAGVRSNVLDDGQFMFLFTSGIMLPPIYYQPSLQKANSQKYIPEYSTFHLILALLTNFVPAG
ncbi:unnamed protein product, partial [marine sediment metagenome]